MKILISLLTYLFLSFDSVRLSALNECQNLQPNQIKILGPNKELKVWIESELTLSCCMKTGDLSNRFDDFDSQFKSGIAWFDAKGDKMINYFSNPTEADQSGKFFFPDIAEGDESVKMAHLVVKNFSKADDGNYKCDTLSGSSTYAKQISLKGFPRVLIDSERVQFLEEGRPGNIICSPRGHPRIDVAWFFGGKHLSPDDHKFSFLKNHRVLGIAQVTERQAGTYVCKAEVTRGAESSGEYGSYVEVQPIRVVVFQRPTLSSDSPIVKSAASSGIAGVAAIEDGSLQLACDSTGLPPPVISWFRNGELLNASRDSRVRISESYYLRNLYSNLSIEPVRLSDIGVYSCNSSVGAPSLGFQRSVANNVTPEMAFHPRFLTAYTRLNVTSLPAKNVQLNCTVYGAMNARLALSFVRDGFKINNEGNNRDYFNESASTSDRFSYSQWQDPENIYVSHMRLHIYDLQPEDAGWYFCRANLATPDYLPSWPFTRSDVGAVSVYRAPHIVLSSKKQQQAQLQQKLQQNITDVLYGLWYRDNVLVCRVKAFPQPNWEWHFRGVLVRDTPKQYQIKNSVANDSATSQLLIRPNYLNDAIFGSYVCTAENQFGRDAMTISLRQATRPGPPIVQVCKVTASSIQLCVSPNNDTGGLPLTHYELRIKEFDQQQSYNDAGSLQLLPKQRQYNGPYYYPVSPTKITLSHLKSATGYKLALSSASGAGRGANSYIEVTTKPISTPIVELVNTSNAPDWNAFNLRWKVESDGGLPIVQFDVQIQQVIIDPSTGNVVDRKLPVKSYVIDDLSQIKHVFRVNSLQPHTWYELRFQARNLLGASLLQEVVFRTLDAPASMARTGRLRALLGNGAECSKHGTLFLLLLSLFFWSATSS